METIQEKPALNETYWTAVARHEYASLSVGAHEKLEKKAKRRRIA